MKRVLIRAVAALYKYYNVREDSRTAYRSAIIVFSGGPTLNIRILCEFFGLMSFSDWSKTTDGRLHFYGLMFISIVAVSFAFSRFITYEAVISEVVSMKRPKLAFWLTVGYLLFSVFGPLLFISRGKALSGD